jgi:peptidyl-prolyl cis-trans isomerase SurA
MRALRRLALPGLFSILAASGASAAYAQAAPGGGINLGFPSTEQAAPAPAAKPKLSESVAALVNDDPISSYDVRQRMRLLVATTGVQPNEQNIPQIEREALRGLVDEHLEMQEVKAIEQKQKDLHLEPDEDEIDGNIGEIAKQSGISRQQLISTLKSDGVDPRTLRDQIKAQMSWTRYIGARFRDAVVIGDNQITSAVRQANASSLKPQYNLALIFLDASHVGGQQAAEDGAHQLILQMKNGAPFGAVARQFSALPTAANGGDLGWVVDSDLKPEVRAAVEQMKPGDLSAPIITPTGVYIVLLREKRAGANDQVVDLRQAAISLGPAAPETEVADAQAKLARLRKRVVSCDTLEAQADKIPGVLAADLGETSVDQLRPAFRDAVQQLKVGDVSAPIRTDVGLHLIAVCSRHAAGVEGVTRADVTDRLRGEQLSMFARRYLRDLRNSAEIETR